MTVLSFLQRRSKKKILGAFFGLSFPWTEIMCSQTYFYRHFLISQDLCWCFWVKRLNAFPLRMRCNSFGDPNKFQPAPTPEQIICWVLMARDSKHSDGNRPLFIDNLFSIMQMYSKVMSVTRWEPVALPFNADRNGGELLQCYTGRQTAAHLSLQDHDAPMGLSSSSCSF